MAVGWVMSGSVFVKGRRFAEFFLVSSSFQISLDLTPMCQVFIMEGLKRSY